MNWPRLIAFLRLGRPLFLAGGLIMDTLGVAMALFSGAALNLGALIWGQVAISAIQWMTQYANDYFDLAADRANQTPTHWSGGSRVLLGGQIAPKSARRAALTLAAIALVAVGVLAFVIGTGALTIPLLALAGLLAWFYSAPPIRLHSRGLGELTTAILVPGLAPLTAFYLQTGRLEWLPVLAAIPLGGLQFCMLLAIEFPDAEGDHATGKRTLVVRLGEARAARSYQIVLICAYLALPLLVIAGLPPLAALALALMLPLALIQLRNARQLAPTRWNRFAFFSIGLLFASAALEAFAFALLIGMR